MGLVGTGFWQWDVRTKSYIYRWSGWLRLVTALDLGIVAISRKSMLRSHRRDISKQITVYLAPEWMSKYHVGVIVMQSQVGSGENRC